MARGGDFAGEFSSGFVKVLMEKDTLTPAIRDGNKKVLQAIQATTEYWAPRVENEAKTFAPWEDQTGNARNGLAARAYNEGTEYGIILYHQVPYGIWLEVRFSGLYSTIMPTIERMGPLVMSHLEGVLDSIGFER